jgi:formamidopyrimidine-DNA glycosylase
MKGRRSTLRRWRSAGPGTLAHPGWAPVSPYDEGVPELPEVEITARRLGVALEGATIESALAPGINALRSFDPPLSALEGRRVEGVRRRGKHLVVDVEGGLSLLIHLMSAGRLQLYDKRAGPRDRTSRLLVRVSDSPGRGAGEWELRLREFGSKQAAWVKLLRSDELEEDEALAKLGLEAWPDPPAPSALGELLKAPRPLHTVLRDQRTIAGIGRSWVDEILWQARLSPYKRGNDLDAEELERLREAIVGTLGGALEHYEQVVQLPIPDKLPLPLQVHRHEGEACPRCGATLRAVHFEDYVIAYCPACQTEGRVLKDRRLSRLLK